MTYEEGIMKKLLDLQSKILNYLRKWDVLLISIIRNLTNYVR